MPRPSGFGDGRVCPSGRVGAAACLPARPECGLILIKSTMQVGCHMRRRDPIIGADDDSHPVMVPRSDKALVPTPPGRARRLREHLVITLRRMRRRGWFASRARPEPEGFSARVAHAACSLCKGWCCKGGGDHAYLDEPTLARVRAERPDLGARAVARLYVERVPAVGHEGSCVFHGEQGCTLDRSLRSDVCNSYFCAGLEAYLWSGDAGEPVVIVAGEGDRVRTSAVLMP